MRVICIDADGVSLHGAKSPLVQNEVYTASQCRIYKDSYDLKEIPVNQFGTPISFRKYRFIPFPPSTKQNYYITAKPN